MMHNPVIRPVRAGDEIVVEVEGGFVRRKAATDGVVVQTSDRDLFVGVEELLAALRALGYVPEDVR